MDLAEPDRLLGIISAVACGFGFRYLGPIIEIGGVAGVSLVVGACFMALLDALSGD